MQVDLKREEKKTTDFQSPGRWTLRLPFSSSVSPLSSTASVDTRTSFTALLAYLAEEAISDDDAQARRDDRSRDRVGHVPRLEPLLTPVVRT